MTTLELCPFCHVMPNAATDDDGAWVECPDCHTSTGYCDTTADAQQEWREIAQSEEPK